MKQYYFQYVYYLKKLLSRINLVLLFFLLPINSYSSEVFFVEKGSAVIGDVKKISDIKAKTIVSAVFL